MPPFWPFHFHHHHNHHHFRHHNRPHHDDETTSSTSSSMHMSLSSSTSSSSSSSSCLVTESSKRRRIQTSSVSFCPQATQFDHIHMSEITKEERSNAWYSRSELRAIHEENHETVQWMMDGCPSNDDNSIIHCSRGIECKTPMGIRIRMRHRIDAMEACFRFQTSEWSRGRRNVHPERLAEIYGSCTLNSVRVAQLAAKMDRENVLREELDQQQQQQVKTCDDDEKDDNVPSSSSAMAFQKPTTPPLSPAAAA